MAYVIGVDLGTSAVKVLLVNREGNVCAEVSKSYPLIQEQTGYSEQNPEQWVEQTMRALKELVEKDDVDQEQIEGLSFSGQMHGLVLLNEKHEVIRPAILWNDTRTTQQCRTIEDKLGSRLLDIAKNPALEGFTLPKLLWVKEHEPEHYDQTKLFMLPKDYVRFRLTGQINSEYSDAAGTLLLDVTSKQWSHEICSYFDIDENLCPPLVESSACVGTLLPDMASKTGLSESVKVFAGGADNACGAVGAGILSPDETLCSIGTSGVILSYEEEKGQDYEGKVHFFNHAREDAYYTMGVTLAAGYSLQWFKERLGVEESYAELLEGIEHISAGSNGLLFTPYLVGERTPHADPLIRGSFIGLDATHGKKEMVRAVLEGITFSLNESLQIFRDAGKKIHRVISIGGGSKNKTWLQMQANIFNATVIPLENEQGPGMGAAMLAASGCGWFDSLEECATCFVRKAEAFEPQQEQVAKYEELFQIYQQVYPMTKQMNEMLAKYRS